MPTEPAKPCASSHGCGPSRTSHASPLKKKNTGRAAKATGQRNIFTKLIMASPSMTPFNSSRYQ